MNNNWQEYQLTTLENQMNITKIHNCSSRSQFAGSRFHLMSRALRLKRDKFLTVNLTEEQAIQAFDAIQSDDVGALEFIWGEAWDATPH